MTVHTTSTPTMPSAHRRLGRNALLAMVGGTIVLAAAAASAVLVTRSDSSEPVSPPVVAAEVQPSFATSGAPVSGSNAPHTVYVVGSAEQAAIIEAGITDATNIRAAAGEMPLPETESVVVAASDAEAATVVRAINEANGILATVGAVEYTVVDLRGR